jgi:hypothetical protein
VSNLTGPRSDHGSGTSASRAAATANSTVASARRIRAANRDKPGALNPSRAKSGIKARNRARVKRGSRLLGSSL